MRKRAMSLVLSLCMVVSLLPVQTLAAGKHPFTDVAATDWFNDSVQYVYEHSLMNGTSSTTFGPYRTTSRGMLVTILYRMEGEPTITGSCPFPDVAKGRIFEKPITWAASKGIVTGYTSGKFGPDDNLTRQQMAAILYRYATLKGYDTNTSNSLSSFTDANTISNYAKIPMTWANAKGLINGVTSTTLNPGGNATRAQAAAILTRFCENVNEDTQPHTSQPVSYSVTFDLNYSDGGIYQTLSVREGEKVIKPSDPNRSGYSFVDWYPAADRGTKFDFNTIINSNITLYARWSKRSSSSGGSRYTPAPAPAPTPKTQTETYYDNNSQVVSVIPVSQSNDVLTEANVKNILAERGFSNFEITYEYSISGEHSNETAVAEESTEKHPMYQTVYNSDADEMWAIYVINGAVIANPISFNLESDLGVELLVSETQTITSYDEESNKFIVTIPYESAAIIHQVERIDAETLDALTVEEICKAHGATIPTSSDEETDGSDSAYSLDLQSDSHSASLQSGDADSTVSLFEITEQDSNDPIIVVSLGDSYSAGEGITPFYGQTKTLRDKVTDKDWLAHRSTRSWPSLLTIPGVLNGQTLGQFREGESDSSICRWYFGAVSGATTEHFRSKAQTKYYAKKYTASADGHALYLFDTVTMPLQLTIFNGLYGKVDYVTLTIGGNDVHFADVIKKATIKSSYVHPHALEDMLTDLWNNLGTTMSNIRTVYEDIRDFAGPQAAIIVAGYPKLLEKNGKGAVISQREATLINEKVSAFNDEIENLVTECQEARMNIYFVDVEEEFDKDGGHQAYCRDAWINPIWIIPRAEDLEDGGLGSAYSMHPNEDGAKAYARCVNRMIAAIERTKPRIVTISGVVSTVENDTSSIVPLEGASVAIESADFNTKVSITNSDGEYQLTEIPIGTYTLTISKDGYITKTDTIRVSKTGFVVTRNFTVNPDHSNDVRKRISGVITIADTDTDMTNNNPLEGATVKIEKTGFSKNVITNSNGEYELSDIPLGTFVVTVTKDGFIPAVETITVRESDTEIIYNIIIESISNDYVGIGSASGTVYDALNGHAVPDLTLNIREGMGVTEGEVLTTIVTDSNGMYTFDNAQAGNYTVEVVDNRNLDEDAERYYTSSFNIKVLGNNSIPNQNGFVTNGLTANQLRIVLRWGSAPSDLDSHLVGPTDNGGRFHTYYRAKNYYGSSELMANLDLDDRSSYGPETTTIYQMSPGIYTFLVHNYSRKGSSQDDSLARSGANVEVFLGNSTVASRTFHVPNISGTVWAVFSYNSNTGVITPINQMSYQSDPGSVGNSYPVADNVILASTDSVDTLDATEYEVPELKDYEIAAEDSVMDEKDLDLTELPEPVNAE